MKSELPAREEIRQDVLRIIRTTPNKELAAGNIAHMLFERVIRNVEAFKAKTRSELQRDMVELRAKLDENTRQFRSRMEAEQKEFLAQLEAQYKELHEEEEGDWWKKGQEPGDPPDSSS